MRSFVSRKKLLFMVVIIMLTITTGLYATYAINVYMTEGTPSTYDMALTFDLSGTLNMQVTVAAGKTKAYDISVTNPYDDIVQYGIAYTATSPTTLPSGVTIAQTSSTKSPASGTVAANSTVTASIVVDNSSTSSVTLTFSVINGYKNGGDLIVPSGKTLITGTYELTSKSEAVLVKLGLSNSLKSTTPNFNVISPYATSYSQSVSQNQTVSLTSGSKTLGTSISFDSSTGSYTLSGTSTGQAYNTSSIGKYTCNSSSTSCTTVYKINTVTDGGVTYDDDKSAEEVCEIEEGYNVYVGSSLTESGGGYILSGNIYDYDTSNADEINQGYYSCCTDSASTVCYEGSLFEVSWVEDNTIWGIVMSDISIESAGVTNADVYGSSVASYNTNDIGIFAAEDDLGTSYYFRGNVENNYVKFAGYYWRIIRINGDGTVRMIYDGTSAHANGESSTNKAIGTSAYKSSTYNDNAYVGYMYGTAGSSTYEATHTNTNNSTIKTTVDNWYKTNIVDKGYSSYVADAIYCNDRSLYSGTGIGTTITYYAAHNRIKNLNNAPTLKCSQTNDKFTVSASLGNGSLTYPVALITADELVMAGSCYDCSNSKFYLYTGIGVRYWTMTPSRAGGSSAYVILGGGYYESRFVDASSYYARPVISLSSSAITGGTGTASDPFTVS